MKAMVGNSASARVRARRQVPQVSETIRSLDPSDLALRRLRLRLRRRDLPEVRDIQG